MYMYIYMYLYNNNIHKLHFINIIFISDFWAIKQKSLNL